MALSFSIQPRCGKALICVVLAVSAQPAAAAASENRIKASYVVEVGSIPVFKMSYDAALTGKTYQSAAEVKTEGFGGLFSDYRMDMTAAGEVTGKETRPVHFTSRAEKKSKKKTVELSWRDGRQPMIDPKPDRDDAEDLQGFLTPDLVDPLSMILRVTSLHADRPCQSVERVFDGKEVYELRFALEGKEALGPSAQGTFRGQAYKCSVTYMPIAGRSAVKFRKKGLAAPKFTIWFAPAMSTSKGRLFVPVLATGKLKGLPFVAYASKTMIDGIPLASNAD